MNDRLINIGGMLIALVVLAALMLPQGDAPFPRPTSEAEGMRGYAAMARWLAANQIPVVSHRARLSELPEDPSVASTGNILFITMPWKTPLSHDEQEAVEFWVSRGNTLVLVAALNDTLNWSQTGLSLIEDLHQMTSITFAALEAEDRVIRTGMINATIELPLYPTSSHPLTRDVVELVASTDQFTNLHNPIRTLYSSSITGLVEVSGYDADAVWQVHWGSGSVVIVGMASLFSNRDIAKADNARFLNNIVDLHLGEDGQFIFDDYHQGLSTLYDPDAFFADSRLWWTVLFALGFWAVYMVGSSVRLVDPDQKISDPQQGDLVKALGGFMTRKLTAVDTGRLMIDEWLSELEAKGLITEPDETVWSKLRNLPLLDKHILKLIEADAATLADNKKVNLIRLHNHINTLRRNMS
ncbi:MAG: DUF4350 domain-containing protein [Pseudomonadota bacterium]